MGLKSKSKFKQSFFADLAAVIKVALIVVFLLSVYETTIFVVNNNYIEYTLYYNILFLFNYIYKTNLWLVLFLLGINAVWLFFSTPIFIKLQTPGSKRKYLHFIKGLPLLCLILKYEEKHLFAMGIPQASLILRANWNFRSVSFEKGLYFFTTGIISLSIIVVLYFVLFRLFLYKENEGVHNIKTLLSSLLPVLVIILMFLLIPHYIGANYQKKGAKNDFNVLLIVIDALRADHLSCYGYHRRTSPNIDKLAKDGIRFSNAFSHSSHTSGSTPSLFASVYSSQHKIKTYRDFFEFSFTTMAEIFLESAYKTFGVVTNTRLTDLNGYHQGFQTYNSSLIWNNDKNATDVNKEFLDWLDCNDNKSNYFALLFFIEPHTPYVMPPTFKDKFQGNYTGKTIFEPHEFAKTHLKFSAEEKEHVIASYDAEIYYFDHQFGELIEQLKKKGVYDNTLIILTADHGEEFWDHGKTLHGYTLYEEVIHVPLIIKPPVALNDKILKYKSIEQDMVVGGVDVLPTILGLLDIQVSEEVESQFSGKNIFQDLSLYKNKDNYYSFALCEIITNRLNLQSIRTKEWKYIVNNKSPKKVELYNIKNDPAETNNLIKQKPDIAKKLRTLLDKQMSEMKTFSFTPEQIEPTKMMVKELKALGYIN